MNLTIKERIILPQLMPQRGNREQMRLVRRILKKTEFSETEKNEYELVVMSDGSTQWNRYREQFLEVEFQKDEIDFLKQVVSLADSQGNITQHNLSLIEKIEEL